jgi:hypothetical protein
MCTHVAECRRCSCSTEEWVRACRCHSPGVQGRPSVELLPARQARPGGSVASEHEPLHIDEPDIPALAPKKPLAQS